MSGNEEFIAAVLARLQTQHKATEALFKVMESTLADVAVSLDKERLDGVVNVLGALEGGVADLMHHFEQAKPLDLGPVVEAIKGLKFDAKAPVVHNNVQPTPINFEAVMPELPAPIVHNHITVPPPQEQKGAVFEIRIQGEFGRPDKVMTITRKA